MQQDPISFGEWLKERRSALDMTRQDLAGIIGCSWTTVKKIETGERRPSRQVAQLLAGVLEIPPDEHPAFMRFARAEVARQSASVTGAATSTEPHHAEASLAPGPTLQNASGNLPVPPTPLVGRDALVESISRALQSDETRLLTITGPPGIGKTRLALEVARQLGTFPDGIFFIAFDSVREPSLVAPFLVQSLGLKDTGNASPIDVLLDALKGKNMLLLLDNFEQVLEAAPLIAQLLAVNHRLKVLTTSLAPLHVRGEQQIALPPLDLPDLAHLPPVAELGHYAAVQLFVERAKSVRADFMLTEENGAAVAGTCAQLDGLPLAIELVAARSKLMPPEALLNRLRGAYGETPLQMLTGGPRDLPERHRTLRAAIAWSYNLLLPEEQKLFSRMSVFGGCTLPAVQAVCNALGDLQIGVLDGVQSLLDKSLLREAPGSEREPRFGMLGTIRQFAAEKLHESGGSEVLHRWNAEYYQALAHAAETELAGAEQKLWVTRLSLEHENMRTALNWALERGEIEVAARLAGSLWRFWLIRGYLREGSVWLESVLAAGDALPASTRAVLLHGAGVLADNQDDYSRAQQLYEEALVLRRALGDRKGISHILNNLGTVEYHRQNYERAQQLLEESLAIKRALGDDPGIASSLNNLGIVAHDTGLHAQAALNFEESVARARALGHAHGTAVALNNLAQEVRRSGEFDRARTLYDEAATIARGLGDRMELSASLSGLGDLALSMGDCVEAERLYIESLRLRHELGDRRNTAISLRSIAALQVQRERWRTAGVLFGAAETLSGTPVNALSPTDRLHYEPLLEAVRLHLGDSYPDALIEGSGLRFDVLVATVLDYIRNDASG